MQTRITARHFHASPALRQYASERLSKLEKYYNGITDAHVVLRSNATLEKTAEITLNVYRQQLIAHDVAATYEDAIDQCVERLRKQIIKYKAKLRRVDKNIRH
ncbi:MAG: ribosome hibernation-promoting factor, HPF/YfiA family [Rhodothermales bacterium]